jgi:hypothetical protein
MDKLDADAGMCSGAVLSFSKWCLQSAASNVRRDVLAARPVDG